MGYNNDVESQEVRSIENSSSADTDLKKRKIDDKSSSVDVKSSSSEELKSGCETDIDIDSWVVWDNFRHASNSDRRVHIALEFSAITDLNVCTDGE